MEKIKKHSGIIKEFKEFISRGSVMDLAVGIIIGGAFTTIVNSLVKDIIMPFIGLLIGNINFSNLKIILTPASGDKAEAAILYGNFIQNVVNFLIVAFVVFILIKALNSFKKKKAEEPVSESEPTAIAEDIQLLTEIRDLLKK